MVYFQPDTLDVQAIGKGISGSKISDAAYIYGMDDSGDQVEYLVILGSFWSFQQNPSSSTLNIGICFDQGNNCYQLGSGLPLYEYQGSLLIVNQIIYALYLASDKTCRIDAYDFDNGNFTGVWQNIYATPSQLNSCRETMVPWTDASGNLHMVLLGNQSDTDELNGMALYNPSLGWSPFGPFPVSLKKVYTARTSDGVIFLLQGTSYYRWDGESWVSIWNATECYSDSMYQFQAMDEWSFFAPCNHSFMFVRLSSNLSVDVTYYDYPPEYSCDVDYSQSTYSPYSTTFIAVCVGHTNTTYLDSYWISSSPTLLEHKEVGAISLLSKDISSFCAFGNGKMFISGYFDHIGDYSVQAAAVWNGVAWSRLDPSLGITKDYGSCHCAAENGNENSMVVIGCSVMDEETEVYSSFLLFSYESLSDPDLYDPPDNSQTDPDIYPFSVVFQDQDNPIKALSLQSSVAYLAWTSDDGLNSTITRWSWGFEETLFSVEASVYGLVPYNNTIYLSGNFGLNDQGYMVTLARYDLHSKQFVPVQNVWDTRTPWTAISTFFQDPQDNSTIYVGGYFNQAGSLSYAHNIALLNSSNATFVDNLSGGAPGPCSCGTSIDMILYLVYQEEGCVEVPQCLSLISYDRKEEQWSFSLRSGVYQISQGYEYNPKLGKTSGLTWWMLIILGLACIVASAVLFFSVLSAYRAFKRYQMKKLHDGFSHIAYHALLTDLSEISSSSLGPVDFQNEEIVLKSVLGRGNTMKDVTEKKGASYAVKQVLISVGETDKITAVEKEIQILQQLRHKNIVHFAGYKKELTKSSVEFFLFMELFEKPCSLRGMIEKRVKKSSLSGSTFFTFVEVKNFLEQILAGMQYLHHHGIAHRDLKCANILIRAHNITVSSLHIADFGLSKTFLDGANSRILASTVAGTPAFMAPEVLKGSKYDPFKADVWSFGIVVYEILTFQEPKEPGKRPKIPTDQNLPCMQDSFKPILIILENCTEIDPSLRPDVDSLVATMEDL